jgi:hypothetical protein
VSYSLGAPLSIDLSQQSTPSTSGAGLYRHEQDRAEFFYGTQNGQVDQSDPKTKLLAAEVLDFKLTYYGGTAGAARSGTTSGGTTSSGTTSGGTTNADTTANGATAATQWDSTQQGMMPLAVRISISLRRDEPKSMFNFFDAEKRPPTVYSLLVNLPNASVDTSLASRQETPPALTPYKADSDDAGGEKAAGRTKTKRKGQTGKRKASKGKGEKGIGETGGGKKGGGKKGRGAAGKGEAGKGGGVGGGGLGGGGQGGGLGGGGSGGGFGAAGPGKGGGGGPGGG